MVGFQNLFYFVLFIGPLIAVHEAGHYFAAKWANVKVLKFSIGFGPKLFGFRRGETDYQVAVFPLGGFVQMAGMNPDDSVDFESTESERTFLGAPWWKRIIISFAGPAANLIFPLAAFFIIMLPESSDLAPRIGSVEPESPAATAGLRPGDLIVAIDDVPITTFTELSTIASTSADKRLAVTVEREGQRQTFQVTPASVEIAGLIESQRRGRMGISAGAQLPVLGVPEGSTAFQAGLRTFDRVIQIDGAPIRTLMDLDRALKTDAPSRHVVVVRSRQLMPGVVDPELVELDVPMTEGATGLARLGVEHGEAYVSEVRLKDEHDRPTAAANLGIKVGDRFVSIGGQKVFSFAAVQDRMALAGQSRLELAWLSGTELHTGSVGPLAPVGNARYCMKPTDFGVRFGAPGLPLVPVVAETVKINLGIVGAAKASLRKVPEAVMVISKVLSKLPTGQVPIESMGGPLQIFDIAAQSAARGWEDFLTMMAVVSVNLALVNLLPIPILDGFNILLSLWEGVRRRPASLRARELTTYLGLVVLVSMMFRAFWNDIARLLFC